MHHGRRARRRGKGLRASPIPLEEIRNFMQTLIPGPTYQEMLDPATLPAAFRNQAARARADELDPANLFNITWREPDGRIRYEVLPKELTGIQANLLVMVGRGFPS